MKKCRILALVLALCMILALGASCAKKTEGFVSFRDTVITQDKYFYMMSHFKALYLYTYFGLTEDNAEIWEQQMTAGVTVGDYLSALALSNIMSIAVYVELFDDYGLTLTAEDTASVEAQISQLVATAGNQSALEKELSKFGANIETVRSVLTDSIKVSRLQEYLYGENGIEAVSDEEIEKYFTENYMRCKLILIHKKQDYVYDASGEAVYDTDTGKYVTREMTEDEIAEKKALYENLRDRILKNGEDFEALMSEYTMESGMKKFTDGYYVTSASTFVPNEVIVALKAIEVGDVTAVESESGWYILKRLELIEGAWKDENYSAAMFGDLRSTVSTLAMSELVAPYANDIIVDSEIVETYPITKFTPNFSY